MYAIKSIDDYFVLTFLICYTNMFLPLSQCLTSSNKNSDLNGSEAASIMQDFLVRLASRVIGKYVQYSLISIEGFGRSYTLD